MRMDLLEAFQPVAKQQRLHTFERELSRVEDAEVESLEHVMAPPQKILKSRKHTEKLIAHAHQELQNKGASRSKTPEKDLDVMDLRTEVGKSMMLLKMEYFRVLDQIAACESILPRLIWAISNMQRLMSDPLMDVSKSNLSQTPKCTDEVDLQFTPFIEPERVVSSKEDDLRRIRRDLEVPGLWVPSITQVDTLLRLTSATSFGTDYTRYHYPKAADLMDMDFGKARRKKLAKESDRLLTAGWWREGRFDLRPKEMGGSRPSLKEQLRMAKTRRDQFIVTISRARAMIIEWEAVTRQVGCERISRAIISQIKPHVAEMALS